MPTAEGRYFRGAKGGDSGAKSGDRHAPPRLAVSHLFVWTTCCAIFLGLARSLADRPAGALGALVLILVAVGYGTAWMGLVVSVYRLLRSARWPFEPGQWLLAIEGATLALLVAERFVRGQVFRNPWAVIDAVTACLFVLPLFGRKLPVHWKWMFGVVAAVYGWPLAVVALDAWAGAPRNLVWLADQFSANRKQAFAAAVAVVLALVDLRIGHRWGWLHWVGVIDAAWLALLPMIAAWLVSLA
ncbi:MAG TPA: hypothetical protein VFW87_26635 [Pirellulales bacterium]|nr:hypothetical protein [Pirellulales bacterium]